MICHHLVPHVTSQHILLPANRIAETYQLTHDRKISPGSQPKVSRMEVEEGAEKYFSDIVQQRLKGLVYTAEVSSWYMDEKTGRNSLVWSGSRSEFWWSRCFKAIRWGDFVLEKKKSG